jgi:hypothetical protein
MNICSVKIILVIFLINIILIRAVENEKIPQYLSIETETNAVRENVHEFIRKALERLILLYPEDDQIKKDYLHLFIGKSFLQSKMREPNSWHTTCLYIGTDYSKLDSYIYKNFKEGMKIDLVTSTFVYIPNKIMASPVFLNYKLIDNEFPHMTLMVGQYQAVDSNYVLKALFSKDDELGNMYRDGRIESHDLIFERKVENVKIEFEITKKSEVVDRVYIIKLGNVLSLEGVTRKNYF